MRSGGRHTAEMQTGEVITMDMICGIMRIHTAVTSLIRMRWAPVSNFVRSQAAMTKVFLLFSYIPPDRYFHASNDSSTPSSGPQTLHMRQAYFDNKIHDVRRSTGRIHHHHHWCFS
jgi:hypothetical protein